MKKILVLLVLVLLLLPLFTGCGGVIQFEGTVVNISMVAKGNEARKEITFDNGLIYDFQVSYVEKVEKKHVRFEIGKRYRLAVSQTNVGYPRIVKIELVPK